MVATDNAALESPASGFLAIWVLPGEKVGVGVELKKEDPVFSGSGIMTPPRYCPCMEPEKKGGVTLYFARSRGKENSL
jgi:hypothetical protein